MQVVILGGGGIASGLREHYLALGATVWQFSRQAAPAELSPALHWICTHGLSEADYSPLLQRCLAEPTDFIYCSIGMLHQDKQRPEKTLKSLTSDFMLANLQANTVEPAMWLQRLMPHLAKQPRAKLLWLSAKVGSITENQLGGWYSYRASKAALNMLVKTAAIELRRLYPELILVTLHPGTTDTELSKPFQLNLAKGQLQSTEDTAKRLALVADNLVKTQHGHLLNWDGQILPF